MEKKKKPMTFVWLQTSDGIKYILLNLKVVVNWQLKIIFFFNSNEETFGFTWSYSPFLY